MAQSSSLCAEALPLPYTGCLWQRVEGIACPLRLILWLCLCCTLLLLIQKLSPWEMPQFGQLKVRLRVMDFSCAINSHSHLSSFLRFFFPLNNQRLLGCIAVRQRVLTYQTTQQPWWISAPAAGGNPAIVFKKQYNSQLLEAQPSSDLKYFCFIFPSRICSPSPLPQRTLGERQKSRRPQVSSFWLTGPKGWSWQDCGL